MYPAKAADVRRVARSLSDDVDALVEELDGARRANFVGGTCGARHGSPLLIRAVQHKLATLFGKRRGWRLSASGFPPAVLARHGVSARTTDPAEGWTRAAADHPFFYRTDDRRAAAVAAHLTQARDRTGLIGAGRGAPPPLPLSSPFLSLSSAAALLPLQDPAPLTPVPPPRTVCRMEEAITWNRFLERDEVGFMWAPAEGVPWKHLCYRFGISRPTAHRSLYDYALSVIAWRLNGRQVHHRRGRRFVVARELGRRRRTGSRVAFPTKTTCFFFF